MRLWDLGGLHVVAVDIGGGNAIRGRAAVQAGKAILRGCGGHGWAKATIQHCRGRFEP